MLVKVQLKICPIVIESEKYGNVGHKKWRKGKVDGSDGPARLHRRVLAINHSYIPPFGEYF